MGIIKKAIGKRLGFGSRLANILVVGKVVLVIARRLGFISDEQVDSLGLERAGLTRSLSALEMAMAAMLVWRFVYRRSAKRREQA